MTSGTGTCLLTASWPATTLYLSASRTQSTAATKLGSATLIAAPLPNPSVVGQPVTVSFSVTGAGLAPPTGSVTVTATTGESCTGTIASGSCSLTFATTGNRTMTALYLGDANYNTSTSAPSASEAVWDFAMGVNPGSRTVNGGQKASYTATFTSLGGFTGPVALTCSAGPYTCTVTQASVIPSGGSRNATVTVNTTKGSQGSYVLTLTAKYGTGIPATGGLTHTASPSLTVKK